MFRNVWLLTIEENIFAAVNVKKTKQQQQQNKATENHFITENAMFYNQSLNTLLPNSLISTHPFYQW